MNVLDEIKLKTRFSKEKYHFSLVICMISAIVFWKVNLIKKLWLVYLLKETDFRIETSFFIFS